MIQCVIDVIDVVLVRGMDVSLMGAFIYSRPPLPTCLSSIDQTLDEMSEQMYGGFICPLPLTPPSDLGRDVGKDARGSVLRGHAPHCMGRCTPYASMR